MISTHNGSLAARDSYGIATGLPATGARVAISGFPRAAHEELARLLEFHGYQPSAFATGADAVLVPEATPEILEEAERSGRRILLRSQLQDEQQPLPSRTPVEITEKWVRILDVTLPRRPAGSSLVPPAERFAHLCFDKTFLTAARAVAIAADAGLPCALEGETAVAKTTAVLFIAHLCRQDAVRLNLNGQSDTGELVGRFVPSTERAPAPQWTFREGIVPQAMRHGHWVLLDEANLVADGSVIERLNSVLEQPATLLLSENAGERFGVGGDIPVAESFRIFATMNPATYAARAALSPAFRDRFSLWNVLESPGEAEYRALLIRLVHGVHPEFALDGVVWQAADELPLYPQLNDCRGMDDLLGAIAAFHASVAAASGGDGGADLGRGRREPYVFTRRTLMALMSIFAARVERGQPVECAAREALDIVYLQRVNPGPDRHAMRTALRSAGLAR